MLDLIRDNLGVQRRISAIGKSGAMFGWQCGAAWHEGGFGGSLKAMTNLDSVLKSRDITMLTKICIVRATVFPGVMYRCESWTIKNAEWRSLLFSWCFWIMVLEKTLESLLDCKEIKPVNSKENQPWIFIGRTDAEAPTLWSPEEMTHWKRPWCWERLKAKGEEGGRGRDG